MASGKPLTRAAKYAGLQAEPSPKEPRSRTQGNERDTVVEEADGASLPDVKNVSDQARIQFADMLSAVDGKKDIVIQPELMSLLENVTPMKFLRK